MGVVLGQCLLHQFYVCFIVYPIDINSLVPGDLIWCHKTWLMSVLVMACCLVTPSHYLYHCWLTINEILLHQPRGNFTRNTYDVNQEYFFENYIFEMTTTSLSDLGLFDNARPCRIEYTGIFHVLSNMMPNLNYCNLVTWEFLYLYSITISWKSDIIFVMFELSYFLSE